MLCRMKITEIAKGTLCVPQVMIINKVWRKTQQNPRALQLNGRHIFKIVHVFPYSDFWTIFQFIFSCFYSLLLPLQYYFLDFQKSDLFCFYGMFDIPSVLWSLFNLDVISGDTLLEDPHTQTGDLQEMTG